MIYLVLILRKFNLCLLKWQRAYLIRFCFKLFQFFVYHFYGGTLKVRVSQTGTSWLNVVRRSLSATFWRNKAFATASLPTVVVKTVLKSTFHGHFFSKNLRQYIIGFNWFFTRCLHFLNIFDVLGCPLRFQIEPIVLIGRKFSTLDFVSIDTIELGPDENWFHFRLFDFELINLLVEVSVLRILLTLVKIIGNAASLHHGVLNLLFDLILSLDEIHGQIWLFGLVSLLLFFYLLEKHSRLFYFFWNFTKVVFKHSLGIILSGLQYLHLFLVLFGVHFDVGLFWLWASWPWPFSLSHVVMSLPDLLFPADELPVVGSLDKTVEFNCLVSAFFIFGWNHCCPCNN